MKFSTFNKFSVATNVKVFFFSDMDFDESQLVNEASSPAEADLQFSVRQDSSMNSCSNLKDGLCAIKYVFLPG